MSNRKKRKPTRSKGPKKQSKNQLAGTPQQAPKQSVAATQAETSLAPETNATAPVHSLGQSRAQHALAAIKKLEKRNKDLPVYGKYVSYVKALPASIVMSGLGQALAMEKAAGAKLSGHKFLYCHMDNWLRLGWPSSPYGKSSDILAAIIKHDEALYIRAQAEALEYLEWLKKFAVAYLNDDEDVGER